MKNIYKLIRLYHILRGCRIGQRTKISPRAYIGRGAVIGADCFVQSDVIIKSPCRIGDNVIISSGAYIMGKNMIEIGDCSCIGRNCRIDTTENVIIQDQVGIGENTMIWTHGYWPPYTDGYPRKFAGVIIARGAWLQPRCYINPGVTFGAYSIAGAGSLIVKNVKPETVVAGWPAEYRKNLKNFKEDVSYGEFERRVTTIIATFTNLPENDYQFKVGKHTFVINDSEVDIYKDFKHLAVFNFYKKTRAGANSKIIKQFINHCRNYGERFVMKTDTTSA